MELVTSATPIIEALRDANTVVLDTETDGRSPWQRGKILAGIGIRPLGGRSFYMSVRHGQSRNVPLSELHALGDALHGKTLIMHNAPFDLAVLEQEGIELVDEDVLDTMVLWRLTRENEPNYGLKKLAKKYIGPDAGDAETTLKQLMRRMGWTSYAQVPAAQIIDYVANDLEYPEKLYLIARGLIERRGLGPLLQLEQQAMRALYAMARRGFKIDQELTESRRNDLRARAIELLEQIYDLVDQELGERWTMRDSLGGDELGALKVARETFYGDGSVEKTVRGQIKRSKPTKAPRTLSLEPGSYDPRRVLRGMGLTSPARTPTGRESWDKDALEGIDHPIAKLIITWRQLVHARDYYDGITKMADANDVVHASINQAGAKTGRMSVREPALQTLPRNETAEDLGWTQAEVEKIAADLRAAGRSWLVDRPGQESEIDLRRVRDIFVPRPGCFLLMADWDQAELRIMANYARERKMLKAFELGLDVHMLTAHSIFNGLSVDEHERLKQRRAAKDYNFLTIYGGGPSLMAIKLGDGGDTRRAKTLLRRYFERYPGIARFRNEVVPRALAERMHTRCRAHRAQRCGECSETIYFSYVTDYWGRRRYLSDSEDYLAVNFLVQGSAGDAFKEACTACDRALSELGCQTRALLPIHDELIFEVPYDEATLVIPTLAEKLGECPRLKHVRLGVKLSWSPTSWGAAEDLSCDACGGHGLTYDRPRNEMFRLLVDDNWAELNRLIPIACTSCEGRGYTLMRIKERDEHQTSP